MTHQEALDYTTIAMVKEMLVYFPELKLSEPPSNKEFHTEYYYTWDGLAGSVTQKDARVLQSFVKLTRPKTILEVGSYVGWSTAQLCRHLKGVCVSIDIGYQEQVKQHLANAGIANFVQLKMDSKELCNYDFNFDLVFIDGCHDNGYPMNDVKEARRMLAKKGTIFIHDTWMNEVQEACQYLISEGFREHVYDTDSRLARYSI